MTMTSTMEGHIVIGVVQLLTALLQTIFHRENKKTIKESKETLQRIELVLNVSGITKKELLINGDTGNSTSST